MSDTGLQTSLDQVLSIHSVKAEHPNLHAGATDELATLRAQLAEAREALELISYYKNYSTDGEVKTGYGVMHVSDFANRVLKNIR
mgnify:FL=1